MHVRAAVAGILEVEHAGERHLLPLDQPLDRVLRLVRDQARDRVVAFAVRLGEDVLVEQVGRVVGQPRRALQPGARRRDLPARERGAARGLGVALEDHHLGALLLRRQRGDGAARRPRR
jgi:sugar phosphate isomerase/epimerase